MRAIYNYVFLLIFAFGVLLSCQKDSTTKYNSLVSADQKEYGDIQLLNSKNLVVQIQIGSIILDRITVPDIMQYYMYKVVKAKTKNAALEYCDNIILEKKTQ